MRWAVMSMFAWMVVVANGAVQILEYVYPSGGVAGSELVVEVGGDFMPNTTIGVMSGGGVKMVYLGPARETIRKKNGGQKSEVIPNVLRFKVVIDKEATPGIREVRVSTAYRLSEAVGFEVVAAGEEYSKPHNLRGTGVKEEVAELPLTLNGRVCDVSGDRYLFTSAAERTVVAVVQRDTLPANGFVPTLAFEDADGKCCEEVTFFEERSAPVAVFQVPQAGTYALVVKAVQGAPSVGATYRVKLGELPLITALSPTSAKEGESLNVRLEGANIKQRRKRLFTGSKNSALCLQTLVEDAYYLPTLDFTLTGEANAPDYKVEMRPSALNIPASGSALVTLYAQRFNGFEGDISVGLDFPPLSIACEGGFITAGTTQCMMTVSTDGVRFPRVIFDVELVARATIDGQTVKRAVTPVRTMGEADGARVQAFSEVTARANGGLSSLRITKPSAKKLVFTLNQPLEVVLERTNFTGWSNSNYKPVVVWPERGFTIKQVEVGARAMELNLEVVADRTILKSGGSGNLIIAWMDHGGAVPYVYAVSQSVAYAIK